MKYVEKDPFSEDGYFIYEGGKPGASDGCLKFMFISALIPFIILIILLLFDL